MFDRGRFAALAFERGGESSRNADVEPFVIELGCEALVGVAYHVRPDPVELDLSLGDVDARRRLMFTPEAMQLLLDVPINLDAHRKDRSAVAISIPPGGMLVIDTDPDQRWITLDGVVKNEEYTGTRKWFTVDPDTISFEVDCAGDRNLDVQIEYTEKWY